MNYIISNKAVQDLENIWLYTFENWSSEQADRYIHLIVDEIEYLGLNPKSGLDFENIKKGYFRAKVKSHLIFYKINKKKSMVEIIRILHEMMDIESHLLVK